MREIKFRAWDKKTKKMRDVSSIAFHNKRELWHTNESNTPKVINVWGYDIIFEKDIVLHREEEDVILIEYTGLKDKHDKEIYEGDVIHCNYMKFTHFNAVVKLGEYIQDGSGGEYSGTECIGFYADALNKEQMDEWGVKTISDWQETTSILDFEEVEIIGNIYENPELLQEETK